MFFYAFITLHYCSVPVLDGKKIFVLDIHVLSKLGICCGCEQTVYDVHHLFVTGIFRLVDIHHLPVVPVLACLVEYAQHLLKPVVDFPLQSWYLDYDAVVYKALDKGVGNSLGYFIAVIVIRLVLDIKYGHFYISHLVSQQVNGDHGQTISHRVIFLYHILGIGILCAKILSEP